MYVNVKKYLVIIDTFLCVCTVNYRIITSIMTCDTPRLALLRLGLIVLLGAESKSDHGSAMLRQKSKTIRHKAKAMIWASRVNSRTVLFC